MKQDSCNLNILLLIYLGLFVKMGGLSMACLPKVSLNLADTVFTLIVQPALPF